MPSGPPMAGPEPLPSLGTTIHTSLQRCNRPPWSSGALKDLDLTKAPGSPCRYPGIPCGRSPPSSLSFLPSECFRVSRPLPHSSLTRAESSTSHPRKRAPGHVPSAREALKHDSLTLIPAAMGNVTPSIHELRASGPAQPARTAALLAVRCISTGRRGRHIPARGAHHVSQRAELGPNTGMPPFGEPALLSLA